MKPFHLLILTLCLAVAALAQTAATLPPATQPAATPAATQPAATQPVTLPVPVVHPSPEVLSLVAKLNDDDYSIRLAAQDQLTNMGQLVLPQLMAVLQTDPGMEATGRIMQAIHLIDIRRQLGPSVITMHYKNAPMADVLADFSNQCAADLGCNRKSIAKYAKNRNVSINLDHADFWTAMLAVGKTCGVHLQQGDNSSARAMLDVNDDNGRRGAAFSDPSQYFGGVNPKLPLARISGPFVIVPASLSLNRMVSYGQNPVTQSTLELQMNLLAEPKLHIISTLSQFWLQECTDDKGRSMMPLDAQMNLYNAQSTWQWSMQTTLHELPHPAKKIARLRGLLQFSVQTASDVKEIHNVLQLKDDTVTAGDETVTFKSFKKQQDNTYQLVIAFNGGTNNPTLWMQAQSIQPQIQIYDDKDNVMNQNGTNFTNSSNGLEVNCMYTINDPQAQQQSNGTPPATGPVPARLRWEVTTETKTVTAPFEIDNLPLIPRPSAKKR